LVLPSPSALRAYRVTCVFIGVALVSFGVFFRFSDPGLYDPFGVRVALALAAWAGAALSYVAPAFRPYFRLHVYGVIAAAIGFVAWLCIANRFAPPHAAAAMFLLSAFGLGGGTPRSERALLACIATLVGVLLGGLAFVENPAVSPLGFGAALVATGGTAYAIVHSRVRSRQLLAEREARYRSVIENASDGIYLLDPHAGHLLEANDAFVRMLGYSPDEIRTLTLERLVVVPPGAPSVADNVARAFETRRFSLGLRTYRRKDGSLMDVEVSGTVIEEGGRELFSVTIHDATDRRRVEMGLRVAKERAEAARASAEAARERAEDAARLKSAFLANMSHEIRTPLTAIIGFSEVLGEEVPEAQREYVRIIESSARRLYSTLNSVLDLAQLEGRALRLRPEPLDLAAEAAAAAGALLPLAVRKGLRLTLDVPDTPVPAVVDRGALTRVIDNLVGNAVKFTEHGGVTVAVAADEDGTAVLRVHDTGIGIEASFIPHLFDEFRQASQGYDRSHEGNGLGLAITKRLVELSGGTVAVESRVGEGTTFIVRLPAPADTATDTAGDGTGTAGTPILAPRG